MTRPQSISRVITNTIIITIITTVMIAIICIIIIKLTGKLIKMLIVEWESNWNGCEGIYLHFKAGGFFFSTSRLTNVTEAREPVLHFVSLWDCMLPCLVLLSMRVLTCERAGQRICVSVQQGQRCSQYWERMLENVMSERFQEREKGRYIINVHKGKGSQLL